MVGGGVRAKTFSSSQMRAKVRLQRLPSASLPVQEAGPHPNQPRAPSSEPRATCRARSPSSEPRATHPARATHPSRVPPIQPGAFPSFLKRTPDFTVWGNTKIHNICKYMYTYTYIYRCICIHVCKCTHLCQAPEKDVPSSPCPGSRRTTR